MDVNGPDQPERGGSVRRKRIVGSEPRVHSRIAIFSAVTDSCSLGLWKT